MPDHARLTWDGTGERLYHTGVKNGVLYRLDAQNAYSTGVAWNGLTGVDSTPDGAEITDLWADNMKYASFRSAESYGGTITAYTFPNEFYACDGYASPTGLDGVHIGQQKREPFGFCYRTEVGDDVTPEKGYVLHLVYGATVSPSEQSHETINDNPDAMEFSWDFETTPVTVTTAIANGRPTSYIELESVKLGDTKMTAIENVLYGSATADARLPLPDEVVTILNNA
jgi:hypothetical protein